MMKQSNYLWFSRMAPYAWIGAILLLLTAEAIVLAAQAHSLAVFSLARRVSLPGVLVGPLAVGAGLARLLQRECEQRAQSEIGELATASIACLTLMAYVILTGTVSMFL